MALDSAGGFCHAADFISLKVGNAMQCADIHIENYFEGEIRLTDGLPATTKADDTSHGFGLRSVRRIVNKYGGTLLIKSEDGMFQVNILLQLTK